VPGEESMLQAERMFAQMEETIAEFDPFVPVFVNKDDN
jgi:hypothetical protein